jgi:hypothetical protein
MAEDDTEFPSPGWRAIDAALDRLYAGREPKHFGTVISWRLGGPDPLDGISAYKSLEPRPHWHFISYGLTELHTKESSNAEISGAGYEFTFRLACDPAEDSPPFWPMNLMQNVARAVMEGSDFDHLHTIDANGPIHVGSDTPLTAILFHRDPQLEPIDTPHGKVTFLQLIGITADELAAKNAWDANRIAELLSRDNPLLITDTSRKSLLDSPDTAQLIEEGIRREGSSCEQLALHELAWHKSMLSRRFTVSLPAIAADAIRRLLAGRILHDKPFMLFSKKTIVAFAPAATPSCRSEKTSLIIGLTAAAVEELVLHMLPKQSEFTLQHLPKVKFRINRTEIRDKDGKVTDVIG